MLFDRKRTLRTSLAACLLALGTLATAAHKAQDTPVAWVNGQPVQRTTLVELLNQRAGAAAAAAPGRPLAPVTLADRQRALDDIIQMELLMQRAEAEAHRHGAALAHIAQDDGARGLARRLRPHVGLRGFVVALQRLVRRGKR